MTMFLAMPNDLKAVNRWKVLKAFQDGKEHTPNENTATGAVAAAVVEAAGFFSDNGLLESGGKGDWASSGGKKPEFFVFTYKKLCLLVSIRGKEFICLF